MLKELRGDLDSLMERQADRVPSELVEKSIREGMFPQREGNMMDTLYTRQYFADDEDDEMDEGEIPPETITDYYEAEMKDCESVDYLHGGTCENKTKDK
jgi:hypothetical protein